MKAHVLVVDDEIQNLELARIILLKEGYTLSFASSGHEALACVRSESIDVIVLDLFMPEVDGFEVLKQVRVLYPSLPVIVVTAYTDTQSHERALALGANETLTKPYDIIELKQRVNTLVKKEEILLHKLDYEEIEGLTKRYLQKVRSENKHLSKEELLVLFQESLSP